MTFLFTDIEGSSSLWEQRGAEMGAVLARHDVLVRGAISAHDGFVFSTGGDGFAAAFARAGHALAAAVEAQSALQAEPWPAGLALRVRMGLHTGEPEERDGDYFGPTVNRAARLMALADGGQVVLSRATAELVTDSLGDHAWLVDRGEHELRSLSRRERVYQLIWSGCDDVSAGWRDRGRGNGWVPGGDRRLIGRDAEIAAVGALLEETPLVTLTGVGGVGKTSLALAVARRRASDLLDGVWFCELAELRDPHDVAPALAERLGLRPQAGLTQTKLLVRALAERECLLVLDNCEHLLDAVAELAERVVEACSRVRLLATSREGLGVRGERLFTVRPLGIDDAVRLFRARAGEHGGGYAFTDDDSGLVADLCGRLDGLPLAIELAAARARTMSIPDLAGRVGVHLAAVRGHRRAAERHQTLRATMAWSYELLTAPERRLFERLSVFAGGFDLAAAEAVGMEADLGRWDVDDLVVSLVDKSMLLTGEPGRYVMLETLREFGAERLEVTGSSSRARDLHLAYFVRFAVDAHAGLQGPEQVAWLERLRDDWANLRAAFCWAEDNGRIDAASTIAVHLIWTATWHDRGEPLLWVESVRQLPEAPQSRWWPSVLAGCALAVWDRGELEAAVTLGRQALTVARPGDEPIIDHCAHHAVYLAAHFLGRREVAGAHLDDVLRLALAENSTVLEAMYRGSAANFHIGSGRYDEARRSAARARELGEMSGNPGAIAWGTTLEGVVSALLHEPSAEAVLRRGVDLATASGSVVAELLGEHQLAALLLRSGQVAGAARLVGRGLQTMRRKASWIFVWQGVAYAARILADGDTAATGAVLYGSFRASAAASALVTFADALAARLSARLGEERFRQLTAEGARLPLERAVALAETSLEELATD